MLRSRLRQQVIVLSRKSRSRVQLRNIDRLVFVWLYRLFPSILNAITVVKPETVIGWHRRGFRAYWRWKSCRRGGRPRIDREIHDLIRRMNKENPLWGAPRIHSELLMLGIEVAESTVARHMIRRQGPPSQGWKTFLRNHAAGIYNKSSSTDHSSPDRRSIQLRNCERLSTWSSCRPRGNCSTSTLKSFSQLASLSR